MGAEFRRKAAPDGRTRQLKNSGRPECIARLAPLAIFLEYNSSIKIPEWLIYHQGLG
jgi:hypothetical protein